MNKQTRILLGVSRIAIGSLFLYAGYAKFANPDWTAAGYLEHASTFANLYEKLLDPTILPVVNILNEWGLMIIGACLILGLFTRAATLAGITLMLLYYFPSLQFPYVDSGRYFVVSHHIIFALLLGILNTAQAGHYIGLGK